MSEHSGTGAPDLLTITVERQDGATRLTVVGEVDASTGPELERVGGEACAAGGDLTLDLAQVEFLDSSGLRVIVGLHQQLESCGHRLTLVEVHPRVMRVIEATNLQRVLSIDSTAGPDKS